MRLQTVAPSSASTCHAGTSDPRNTDRATLLGMRLDPNMDDLASTLKALNLAIALSRDVKGR